MLYQLSYVGLTKLLCRSLMLAVRCTAYLTLADDLLNRDRQEAAKTLVDREGFEPSYLARRDRFTVCWL